MFKLVTIAAGPVISFSSRGASGVSSCMSTASQGKTTNAFMLASRVALQDDSIDPGAIKLSSVLLPSAYDRCCGSVVYVCKRTLACQRLAQNKMNVPYNHARLDVSTSCRGICSNLDMNSMRSALMERAWKEACTINSLDCFVEHHRTFG